MNRRNVIIRTLCIASLVAALPVRAQPKGPFEVKSGILESTTDGAGEQTAILYFDEFGRKQATYTTVSIDLGGQKSVTHKLRIDLADGTSYDVDLDEKTGVKTQVPPEAAAALGMAMAHELKKDTKARDLPEKDLLGKRCKGVEVELMGVPTRAWTWKGLTLYSEATLGGGARMVTRATKLTVDVPVPAEKFKVPAGVKVEDGGG